MSMNRVAFVLSVGMVIGGLFDLGFWRAATGIIVMLCIVGLAWIENKEER